jgi:acetyltransferase-like isoleucine patch superfamily enzyme
MNDKDREPIIHPTAHVDDSVTLGDWTVIHKHVELYGDVTIGRAGWILPYTIVGGGQKELGHLRAGDFFHTGMRSFINIADAVAIGDEVGLGMETKLFTHGGYLNQLQGFPYQKGPIVIGDEVWLPKATVLPNVMIGSNVVVAAESLVNRNLPSGCLAGGIPVSVLNYDAYKSLVPPLRVMSILNDIYWEAMHYKIKNVAVNDTFMSVGGTMFFPLTKGLHGPATKDTERVKDLFRRHGIRFRYYDNGGEYVEWD